MRQGMVWKDEVDCSVVRTLPIFPGRAAASARKVPDDGGGVRAGATGRNQGGQEEEGGLCVAPTSRDWAVCESLASPQTGETQTLVPLYANHGCREAELVPGHDFLPEARPEPVSKILTRLDIFEHFKYPTKLPENEFDTRK